MTRKDFELIARALRDEREHLCSCSEMRDVDDRLDEVT